MDAEQYKEAGNQAFKAGNYDEAIKNFSSAVVAGGPNTHIYYSNLSAAYYAKGEYHEATEAAKQAIDHKEDFAKGYIRLVNAMCNTADFTATIPFIQTLTNFPPSAEIEKAIDYSTTTIFARGTIFAGADFGALKDIINQLGGLSSIVSQDPSYITFRDACKTDSAKAFMLLQEQQAKVQEMMKNIPKDTEGQQTTETAPTEEAPAQPAAPAQEEEKPFVEEEAKENVHYSSLKSKADTFFRGKDYEHAIETYKEMNEIKEDDPVPLNNIAACLINLKRHEEAIEYTDKCVAAAKKTFNIDQVVKALGRKGSSLIALGRLEDAKETLKRAQLEKKTRENAIKLKEVEVELAKRNKAAYIDEDLGLEAKQNGDNAFRSADYNEALKFYGDALKRFLPENPNYIKVLSNRAQTYAKILQLEAACDDFTTILTIDPNHWMTYMRRAGVMVTRKLYHKAKKDLQIVVDSCPDAALVARARNDLGDLANKLAVRRSQLTEEDARAAVTADPELGALLNNPAVQDALKKLQSGTVTLNKLMEDAELGPIIETLFYGCVI